jgi:hypothetical protein
MDIPLDSPGRVSGFVDEEALQAEERRNKYKARRVAVAASCVGLIGCICLFVLTVMGLTWRQATEHMGAVTSRNAFNTTKCVFTPTRSAEIPCCEPLLTNETIVSGPLVCQSPVVSSPSGFLTCEYLYANVTRVDVSTQFWSSYGSGSMITTRTMAADCLGTIPQVYVCRESLVNRTAASLRHLFYELKVIAAKKDTGIHFEFDNDFHADSVGVVWLYAACSTFAYGFVYVICSPCRGQVAKADQ